MEVSTKVKAKRKHLNTQQCEELGQSSEGSDVLTQPHTFNHGRGNPHWGLLPQTPTKRRRSAPTSGSPSGHQQRITNFFVQNISSTSPHKSSPPPTPACYPNQVQEEKNDEEWSRFPATSRRPDSMVKNNEEIDDSLLAGVEIPEVDGMDEEEIDDATLLGVPMGSEPEGWEEREVDYLEGMTAEMFGDDNHFNGEEEEEEEEVEALPDAHYGLLGSHKALLAPQGFIDDLPEEMLRYILSLLPAQDLYRSVSLVSLRWRNVVQDPKFVPFKKQYFRYMRREREAVEEVSNILRSSGITDPTLGHNSVRNLVVLMAQHNFGERVNPEDVLRCVKKHRLFPMAEASIRLRIPDIQKHLHLGLEGPNPFAAMAVILVLNETVEDVQELVSLLRGCLSLTNITEYLCHMATLLLGLKRKNIFISNKPHYNIYYVLYLLENGPFTVSCSQNRRRQIHLTREQQQILSHDIQEDHVVKIIALAGTGKTTTLVKYAEQRPHLRFLYVAFNKSVASEAQRRFPRNVDCKTVHSLAYDEVGKSYRTCNKLTFNVNPFAINAVQPKGRGGFVKSKIIATTLRKFMASVDPTISHSHVPRTQISKLGIRIELSEEETMLCIQDAKRIWRKMTDLKEKSRGAYYMTHDGYLKLWQLQQPKPRLSDQYDVLFIDEAQDCTPAIMDVLLSQSCGKILVGDPHQQIYTFKGAVNALNIAPHTHIYYLTQSFRFGPEIAYVSATILNVCKRVEKILVGGTQEGGICGERLDEAVEAMKTGVSGTPGKMAILSRCNLGVFTEGVRLTEANPNCCLYFIGDIQNIGLEKILDIWHLFQQAGKHQTPDQQPKFFKDPLLRSFAKKPETAFSTLKNYATQTEDRELESKLAIVEKYRDRIPELVRRLRNCHQSDINNADFILGTVHKAKGLEFDTVMVNDDFLRVPSPRQCPSFSFSEIPDDEWNLLYVAVSRAKTSLIITKSIRRILKVAGEYLLKSEMPDSLMGGNNLLPCSNQNCPNCIAPGSAFVMRERAMNYMSGRSEGGPLCERCVWTRIGPTAFLMADFLPMAKVPRRFMAHDIVGNLFIDFL